MQSAPGGQGLAINYDNNEDDNGDDDDDDDDDDGDNSDDDSKFSQDQESLATFSQVQLINLSNLITEKNMLNLIIVPEISPKWGRGRGVGEGGGLTNERPQTDYVISGPIRGLKKLHGWIATTRPNWPRGLIQ